MAQIEHRMFLSNACLHLELSFLVTCAHFCDLRAIFDHIEIRYILVVVIRLYWFHSPCYRGLVYRKFYYKFPHHNCNNLVAQACFVRWLDPLHFIWNLGPIGILCKIYSEEIFSLVMWWLIATILW